ncbi:MULTISPECIES: DNA-formamidopyrimidine glycosylase family protein [unclassified Microbulbifer]|uniref:Fpg/Nei family DNA glycosylase n=1 Tax=unclassified Microbulbifer TaxID=2619833 RepID=UPI0027E5691C|nr:MULTISPECIES: DNA-formamidopyrimidine glycosylase family protein [unclassified Microbulbifer]
MPELPDVENFRRYFNATSLHQRISRVHVEEPALLFETSPQGLGRALKRRDFQSTRRHGKYLFADTGERWLVLHFGMSGSLHYSKKDAGRPKYTRLSIEFENDHQLAYTAPRKLGRIALADSPEEWIEARELGEDALDISEEQFLQKLSKRRGQVKSWLMDQHSLAGIGNIYSDEILFQTGLHPKHSLQDLDEEDRKQLYRTISSVLKTAIEKKAEPERMPDKFLLPHRKQGGHCPACGATLKSLSAAGRTAWYCPRCQAD